jgi:ABC-type dipeptide/oligopeptide/nickel transport system permease component
MAQQLSRRLVQLVPTVFAVATMIFVIFRIVPGDPATLIAGSEATAEDRAMIERQLGLDRPIHVQYISYLRGLAQGDMGNSLYSGRPVLNEVLAHFPATLMLAASSLVIAVPIGIALGVVAAIRYASPVDYGSMMFAVLGVSLPNFWIGLMLMVVFAVKLGWLPSSGMGSPSHLILPAISLGLPVMAIIARLTRSSMLEVLHRDYVRTARAKGLGERSVITRHALRNSLIPTVTAIGLMFGTLLGGSVIIESLFSWPGLGRLLITAVRSRDYPIVQGAVFLFAVNFVLINAIVDSMYMLLDPRTRT